MRRSLGVALWTLVGLLACFLGALNALVGTHAGRTLLARVASTVVEGAVDGSIEVGEVRGSLLTGVVLTDVRLLDPDSTLVAWLPRAELGYNPIDFAAGRVVFMEVRLDRPIINIVQHANGRTNFDELLRLGEKDTVTVRPLGPAGPRSLILLRNVQIMDGSLTLRLQKHGQVTSANEEIEFSGEDGRYRVRRFEHLNARLAAMRIQAPREKGIRIDILRLATEASDPKLSIADVVGRLTIDGRTLDVDLSRVRFPATQFRARGTVQWPRDTLLWNLVMQADSATLTDIRFLDPRFPEQAVLHGGVTLASHGGRVLEIQLRPLDLTFAQGRLTGRVNAFSAADSGLVALRQGDLVARELSLDFPRVYIDSLPFHGRLTGRTVVDGPMSALKIETEWSFRDSLVPGWPESQILGKGEISVAGKELAFQPFAVATGRIDIGTVRRLVPAFDRSEEHTSELQSHSDLHSFPTRRSSDLGRNQRRRERARIPAVRCSNGPHRYRHGPAARSRVRSPGRARRVGHAHRHAQERDVQRHVAAPRRRSKRQCRARRRRARLPDGCVARIHRRARRLVVPRRPHRPDGRIPAAGDARRHDPPEWRSHGRRDACRSRDAGRRG